MKYFESFLQNKINNGTILNNSKIEIDVHCDIEVFEWLISYLMKKNVALTKRTVISILISSNFLRMEKLEKECIKYFHDNINDILNVPFDMTCINNELLTKLLNSFTEIELDSINDKKDKIISQFYILKLEQLLILLEKKFVTFSRCQYCFCFYANNLKYKVFCPFAKSYIDFHGNIVMTHKPEENFNATEYIVNLIENSQYSAKEIYWHIWNSFKSFKCRNCNNLFYPEQQVTCLYHPKEKVSSEGEYTMNSCCNTKNYKFHPFYLSKGCQYKAHIPQNPNDEKIIKVCRKATLAITKSICNELNESFKGKNCNYSYNYITEIDLRNFGTWSDINLISNNQINEKLTNQNGNISINSTNNTNGRQNKNETEKSKKKKIETYLIKEREKLLMNSIMEGLSPPN
ncbi:hypothetical protein LY90DRAFT_669211 [Neocallimastix californiae]|uniref:SANT and BTB domain-containing protein n=1 Tax=Neocallimastix californiae TaxID=1754190 RepID=A0A1Y2DDN9_9FUNG|nr:hypothetical protein LY90DRAFT_669211 [Neocallimastix californiae]|eukprot:ORY57380.1 hypothetical protein LY90DRAFT_669211 [Neocallimastix californiae]